MTPRRMLDDPLFQSAFVAVSQLLGTQAKDALGAFREPAPDVVLLCRALASEDRTKRAKALALTLEHVVRRLEERRLA